MIKKHEHEYSSHILQIIAWASQEFDVVEYFAGRGNLTKYMKLAGFRAGSLDILYATNGTTGQASKKRKSNPMNLLSVSGFASLGLWISTIKNCLFYHAIFRIKGGYYIHLSTWSMKQLLYIYIYVLYTGEKCTKGNGRLIYIYVCV